MVGHGLVAITLVAAIPYTKAAHMFLSSPPGAARPAWPASACAPAAADEPAGYATLADFRRRT